MARLSAGMVGPAVLVVVVAACTGAHRPGSAYGKNRGTASAVSGSAVSGSAASGAVSMVSCSGSTCSVTLAGTGSRAHVLGTTISFGAVDGDQATLRVGGQTVTCTPGEEVTAGSLRLTCTTVADGAVTFTASQAR